MKDFGKILKLNMIILFSYTILVRLLAVSPNSTKGGEGVALILMLLVGVHVLVNFIVSGFKFYAEKNEQGKGYLLSTFLVLVIGFSACWGAASY